MVSAQTQYSTTHKGAIKNYESATEHYDARDNEKAREELLKAIGKDANFIEAYILLANVYVDMRQYDSAIEEYKKALAVNPNFFPNNYYTLANIEMNTGKYEDA